MKLNRNCTTVLLSITLCFSLTFLVSSAWPQGEGPTKQQIVTFDAPGAGTGAGQGTFPLDVNPSGAITGYYVDASNLPHGFLRAKDGSITTIDPPGAIATFAYSINPSGAIAGFYQDASAALHGFLRAKDGSITTFDAPGAGTGAGQGTQATNINPAGAIAGDYWDSNTVAHGFLRAKDGTFTTFDAPGAGTGTGQGTYIATVDCLNPQGAGAGGYINTGSIFSGTEVGHGAVRAADGTITEFDVPGAGTGAFQGTFPFQNNSADAITGYYIESSNVFHGFLRK
jgi:predicted membrane protein